MSKMSDKLLCGVPTICSIKLYSHRQTDSGFSLVEMLAVVLMIGILAAFALPSWLAFVQRQQVNKANEAVLGIIQNTQQKAKQTKNSYSVFFRKNSTTKYVEFAIVQTKKDDGSTRSISDISTWQPLGSDLGIDSKKLLVGTNLSSENTASSLSYGLSTAAKLTFDYMGTLPNANFGTAANSSTEAPGLKMVVALPKANSNTPTSVKRCVIVKTLLGSIITEKNEKCD